MTICMVCRHHPLYLTRPSLTLPGLLVPSVTLQPEREDALMQPIRTRSDLLEHDCECRCSAAKKTRTRSVTDRAQKLAQQFDFRPGACPMVCNRVAALIIRFHVDARPL